jgi:hypothetical protein
MGEVVCAQEQLEVLPVESVVAKAEIAKIRQNGSLLRIVAQVSGAVVVVGKKSNLSVMLLFRGKALAIASLAVFSTLLKASISAMSRRFSPMLRLSLSSRLILFEDGELLAMFDIRNSFSLSSGDDRL